MPLVNAMFEALLFLYTFGPSTSRRATHHARPRVVVAVAAVVGILQGRVVENPTDQSDEWNRSASDPWIPV